MLDFRIIFLALTLMFFFPFAASADEGWYNMHGKAIEIKIVPDDISFYTWSVYIQVKLPWTLTADDEFFEDLALDSTTIREFNQQNPTDIHEFGRQGFGNKKEARKFVRKLRLRKKACFVVTLDDAKRYLKGESARFRLDSIEFRGKCN